MSMYLAPGPGWYSDPIAAVTSSAFHTRVTLVRDGVSAIRSSASRPMNSWSNLTVLPYPMSYGVR